MNRNFGLVHLGPLLDLEHESKDAAAAVELIRAGMAAFSCRQVDVTAFLRDSAETYHRADLARTYLYINTAATEDAKRVAGYFSLGLTSITLSEGVVSGQKKRSIAGHQHQVAVDGHYGAFLVGQLARNQNYGGEDLSGEEMLGQCELIFRSASSSVGGRSVVADCTDALRIKVYERLGYTMINSVAADGTCRMARRLDA